MVYNTNFFLASVAKEWPPFILNEIQRLISKSVKKFPQLSTVGNQITWIQPLPETLSMISCSPLDCLVFWRDQHWER